MTQPQPLLTQPTARTGEFTGELAGHRLLMTSLRTGNTEIFCFDPYSGSATNLTRNQESHHRYPSWAPDGSKIAFTSDRDGAYNLYVMDADGSHLRRLTQVTQPEVVYFPSWSADGKRIVFGLAGCEPALMCEIDLSGTFYRVLGNGRDPHASPKGKLIAFTRFMSVGYVVCLLDSETQEVRQLTEHENRVGAVTPTFSPDGRFIVYSDTVDEAMELFRMEVGSGEVRQLTALGQVATSAAWSPDGQWISFRVTDEDFWNHPDRMKLAYEKRLAEKRPVWVMGADGSAPHVLECLKYQCGIDGSRAVWDPLGGAR